MLLCASTCTCRRAPDEPPRPNGTRVEKKLEIAQVIYDGKLENGWQNYGWGGHPSTDGKGPVQVDFSNYSGWIVAHPDLTGQFGALVFRLRAPRDYGEFLEVRVESNNKNVYPRVMVRAQHRRDLEGDWVEIVIPMRELDPEGLPWDRIVFRAASPVGNALISIDGIGLSKADPSDLVANAPTGDARDVNMSVDCKAAPLPINPMVYSIAFDPQHDSKDTQQFELGAAARRWGGNPSSRYNWQLGNAWNTALDWFFENVNYTPNANYSYKLFFADDDKHAMKSVLTVPMIGWVAKDTTSSGFPKSKFPDQQSFDQWRPEAGNGVGSDGKPIAPPPQAQTSVEAKPEFVKKWIEAIRADDAKSGKRSVSMYILDNEPALWDSTHRDVHPEPLTYDELLERTIAYGTAVRAADADAVIAGPAEWGWPAYSYSAKDAKEGFQLKPDRLAHGDMPLLAWYLMKLKAHEQKTGTRILDVVDLHFYPQGKGVFGSDGGIDKETSALRIRQTRGLWDPSYVDESWIGEPVMLVPRMKKWIDENYPGRGISIGEWNFGAEKHMSGGLAVAEMLGRFGQLGVTSAFYWTYPPKASPAYWAFLAFRNFDGKGGKFLDGSIPTNAEKDTSLFASIDASKTHMVIVALNFMPDRPMRPKIVLNGCKASSQSVYEFAGAPTGFAPKPSDVKGGEIDLLAAPYSITVVDVHLSP
jgi:hypothetical protein